MNVRQWMQWLWAPPLSAPRATILIRTMAGAVFLWEGVLKFVYVNQGVGRFTKLGMPLPEVLAPAIAVLEIVGGLCFILGVWTRYAALAGIPILLGAIFTVHGAAGFFFTNPKGGWEYPAFWTIALVAQALLGDGAYALRPSRQNDAVGGLLSGAHSR